MTLAVPAGTRPRRGRAAVLSARLRGALALALAVAGCGGASPAPAVRAVETERYHRILLDGVDPSGLAWDDARRMLFVGDHDRPRVLVVSNGVVLGERPLAGAGRAGGGLVALGDGVIASARSGTDDDGGVVRLLADEAVRPVPGLDPARHRHGIGAYGDLYVAWFTGGQDAWTGGVARVDLGGGGEVDVMVGLGEAVGIAILEDLLVVSDRSHDSLVGCHLPACRDRALLATVPSPDLMTPGEDEVFVSSGDGSVYAVTSAGASRLVARELGGEPRGLAWDGQDRQLFVAVHDPGAHPRHAIAVVDVPSTRPAAP